MSMQKIIGWDLSEGADRTAVVITRRDGDHMVVEQVLHGDEAVAAVRGHAKPYSMGCRVVDEVPPDIKLTPLDECHGPNRGGDGFGPSRMAELLPALRQGRLIEEYGQRLAAAYDPSNAKRRLLDACDRAMLYDMWVATGQEPPKPKPRSTIPEHLARPWQPPRVLYKTGRAVGKSTSLAAPTKVTPMLPWEYKLFRREANKLRAGYTGMDSFLAAEQTAQDTKAKLAKACIGVLCKPAFLA